MTLIRPSGCSTSADCTSYATIKNKIGAMFSILVPTSVTLKNLKIDSIDSVLDCKKSVSVINRLFLVNSWDSNSDSCLNDYTGDCCAFDASAPTLTCSDGTNSIDPYYNM